MMNDDQPAPATANDVLAYLGLAAGTDGIPRLMDEVIWHVRNARAATQIITEEDNHPPGNWHAAAAKWDHIATLVAELRGRTEERARQ